MKACEGAAYGLKRWGWLREENSLRKYRVRPPVQPQGSLKGWEAGTRRKGQVSRSRGIRAESKDSPDLRGSYHLWIFRQISLSLLLGRQNQHSTSSPSLTTLNIPGGTGCEAARGDACLSLGVFLLLGTQQVAGISEGVSQCALGSYRSLRRWKENQRDHLDIASRENGIHRQLEERGRSGFMMARIFYVILSHQNIFF